MREILVERDNGVVIPLEIGHRPIGKGWPEKTWIASRKSWTERKWIDYWIREFIEDDLTQEEIEEKVDVVRLDYDRWKRVMDGVERERRF